MKPLIVYVFIMCTVLYGGSVVDGGATQTISAKPGEKPVFQFTYGTGKNQQSFVYADDNVAAASSSRKTAGVEPSSSSSASKQGSRDEGIEAAESQHVQLNANQPQLRNKIITESEFLELVREAQKHDASDPIIQKPHQQQHSQQQHHHHHHQHQQQQEEPQAPPKTNGFYRKTADHPLAGSSLESELEKLVNANVHRHNAPANLPKDRSYPPQYAPQPAAAAAAAHQLPAASAVRPLQQQPYRAPVLHKNANDIVYIPYQQQQQAIYAVPPTYRQPEVTKAKVQYIAPENRAPYPGAALEQSPKIHTGFTPSKVNESFKELYRQQQLQNHLRRLQNQQQQQQQHQQPQYQQAASEQEPGGTPHSSIYVSQTTANEYAAPHQKAPQSSESNTNQVTDKESISHIAEELFKTPLDEQKPLSQADFKALVDAGYPVQAVPVPLVVGTISSLGAQSPQYSAPQKAPTYHHQPAPQQLSYAHPPQTHSQTPQPQPQPQAVYKTQPQQTYQPKVQQSYRAPQPPQTYHTKNAQPVLYQQQQSQPQTHAQPAPQAYRQPQQYPQLNTGESFGAPGSANNFDSEFSYQLAEGETEEEATEQLRQRVIQEIHARNQQQQQQSASGPTKIQLPQPGPSSYRPAQQYPVPAAISHRQHQHQQPSPQRAQVVSIVSQQPQNQKPNTQSPQSQPPQQPLSEEQKQYYKRLEYY